jgi:hypothetical protein
VPPHLTATALELGIRSSYTSLLMLILMLLLTPLLVNAILLFPELSQLWRRSSRVHTGSPELAHPELYPSGRPQAVREDG